VIAPPFIAQTDIGMSPYPMMKMIGRWMFAADGGGQVMILVDTD
jgi:hypothetical protein